MSSVVSMDKYEIRWITMVFIDLVSVDFNSTLMIKLINKKSDNIKSMFTI